jgi:hypothetical protein
MKGRVPAIPAVRKRLPKAVDDARWSDLIRSPASVVRKPPPEAGGEKNETHRQDEMKAGNFLHDSIIFE